MSHKQQQIILVNAEPICINTRANNLLAEVDRDLMSFNQFKTAVSDDIKRATNRLNKINLINCYS